MFNIVVKIVVLIMILIGVICIYDARLLTKKFFSFGDQNDGTAGLKFLGFILVIIGSLILVKICSHTVY